MKTCFSFEWQGWVKKYKKNLDFSDSVFLKAIFPNPFIKKQFWRTVWQGIRHTVELSLVTVTYKILSKRNWRFDKFYITSFIQSIFFSTLLLFHTHACLRNTYRKPTEWQKKNRSSFETRHSAQCICNTNNMQGLTSHFHIHADKDLVQLLKAAVLLFPHHFLATAL